MPATEEVRQAQIKAAKRRWLAKPENRAKENASRARLRAARPGARATESSRYIEKRLDTDPDDYRNRQRANNRAYRQTAKGRYTHAAKERRRRLRLGGVRIVVRVQSTECGVCYRSLTEERYPHPMATTVGHEPPIIRAIKDGWTVVAERPEHWGCNMAKRRRLDTEMGWPK